MKDIYSWILWGLLQFPLIIAIFDILLETHPIAAFCIGITTSTLFIILVNKVEE